MFVVKRNEHSTLMGVMTKQQQQKKKKKNFKLYFLLVAAPRSFAALSFCITSICIHNEQIMSIAEILSQQRKTPAKNIEIMN